MLLSYTTTQLPSRLTEYQICFTKKFIVCEVVLFSVIIFDCTLKHLIKHSLFLKNRLVIFPLHSKCCCVAKVFNIYRQMINILFCVFREYSAGFIKLSHFSHFITHLFPRVFFLGGRVTWQMHLKQNTI